jgi:trans-feruloyl-CoA hydratase/vanillin synthase
MAFRDALYYAMTGERFDGKRAADMRWVNFSVPRAELQGGRMSSPTSSRRWTRPPFAQRRRRFKIVQEMPFDVAFNWLLAKSNELKWRHSLEGEGEEGLDKFLRKEFKPGLGSHTVVAREEGKSGEGSSR